MAAIIFSGAPSDFLHSCLGASLLVLLALVGTLLLAHGVKCLISEKGVSHRGWIVPLCFGGALLIFGFLGLYVLPPDPPIWHSIFEALFVAGVIVTLVDPLMKWRLLKEVSEGLFPYMIGFELPDKIRDRLRDMVSKTRLYRPKMTMKLTFTETKNSPGESKVKIVFETQFDVVNPASTPEEYRYSLEFEEAERTSNVSIKLPGRELIPYNILGYDQGVHQCGLDEVKIGATTIENGKPVVHTSHFETAYTQDYPIPGFHLQTFALPTLDFEVVMKDCPETLKVIVAVPEGQRATIKKSNHADKDVNADQKDENTNLEKGDSILYQKVFMPGDGVNIRWRINQDLDKHATRE